MLHLVGLGLADERDITVRGLEVVKKAARVYLEAYTSILLVDKEKLVRAPYNPYCSVMLLWTDKSNGTISRKLSMNGL
jgi:diphthamide biosynthesis methyltransferase